MCRTIGIEKVLLFYIAAQHSKFQQPSRQIPKVNFSTTRATILRVYLSTGPKGDVGYALRIPGTCTGPSAAVHPPKKQWKAEVDMNMEH